MTYSSPTDGRLYVLAVWSPPAEHDNRFGVFVFSGQGDFQRLVDLTAHALFMPGRGPMLAVDSTGNFYLLGVLRRGRRADDPPITNCLIHKFSGSGKQIASFSPLTGQLKPEHFVDEQAFHVLLIDSKDRLHHILSNGSLTGSYNMHGQLLKEYRPKFMADKVQARSATGQQRPRQRYFGAFMWGHRIVLSLGETPTYGQAQTYTVAIDPWDGLLDLALEAELMRGGIGDILLDGAHDESSPALVQIIADGIPQATAFNQYLSGRFTRPGRGLEIRPGRAASDLEIGQDRIDNDPANGIERGREIERAVGYLTDGRIGLIESFDCDRHECIIARGGSNDTENERID